MQSMITTQLLRPQSIVVVGASNNTHKPGGAILKNLINGGYQGELRAVNPKEREVQGVPSFADAKELPDTDLAILAIPAVLCPEVVETLAAEKQTRAFIILSAGFGEETQEGALLEERILETVKIWSVINWPELHRINEYLASQCVYATHSQSESPWSRSNFQFRCYCGVYS